MNFRNSDSMGFKLILRVDGEYEFTCQADKDCFIYFSKNNTPYIQSLLPQHFYAGSQVQFKFRQRSLSKNLFLGIKIGKNTCAALFDESYNYQSPDTYFNCFIGDARPEKITDFLLNHVSGMPSVFSSFYKGSLNKEIFSFVENFNATSGINAPNSFDNLANSKKIFVKSSELLNYKDDSYAFRIFPFISSVSMKEISPFGKNVIKITGQGFNPSKVATKVIIDTNENACIISQITSEEIICETQKLTENLINKVAKYTDINKSSSYKKPEFEKLNSIIFPGSPGMVYKYYSPQIKDEYFTQQNDNYAKVDIMLETSSQSNQGDNYSEYFTGYFKAPITTEYKFYVSSDDFAFVFLWINQVRTKIIDFRSYSDPTDFITNPKQVSEWIPLKGGNVYYIEVIHHEAYGVDHLTLGVEIKNPKYLKPSDSTNNNINTNTNKLFLRKNFENSKFKKNANASKNLRTSIPASSEEAKEATASYKHNQIKESMAVNSTDSKNRLLEANEADTIFDFQNQVPLVQRFNVRPKNVARELYEILLPGNSTSYDLICKNKDTLTNIEKPYNVLTFNTSETADSIRLKLSNFLNEKSIVLKKILLNSKQEYLALTDTESTYVKERPFSAFYNSKKIEYVNDSNVAGVSLLFFLDNSIDKKSAYNSDCTVSASVKLANSLVYNVNLIQSMTNKIDGYFVLRITDEYGTTYKTENLPLITYDMVDYLNKISYLKDKVQVLKVNFAFELVSYTFRLDLNVNKIFFTFCNLF